MKKNLLTIAAGAMFILAVLATSGCVFNVDRITTQKSGEISSVGCTTASIDLSGYSGNVTVNGISDTLIKATVTVSELATKGSTGKPAADQLTVSVARADSVGSVSFSFTEHQNLWELLRLEDVTLACFHTLDVSAITASGNITVAGVDGFVTLETTSGNVTADVARGCNITVESGNIDVTLAPDSAFANAALETSSGNITVIVPDNLKANMDLSTKSGTINCPGSDKTRLNGGSPAVVITCTTTSGNIKIKEE